MNYQALSDDFDGMGTSFGLIQWNFGQGTLDPLLMKMMSANGAAFAGCFGANADFDTLKAAITAGSIANQLSWARNLLKANGPAWKAAFNCLGANDAFNQIQRQQAIAHYHPRTVTVVADLRGIAPPYLTVSRSGATWRFLTCASSRTASTMFWLKSRPELRLKSRRLSSI